jgi:hypothetical protein
MLTIAKLGPAIAAGCTVIIKPAEQTPITTLYLAQLCVEVSDMLLNLYKLSDVYDIMPEETFNLYKRLNICNSPYTVNIL